MCQLNLLTVKRLIHYIIVLYCTPVLHYYIVQLYHTPVLFVLCNWNNYWPLILGHKHYYIATMVLSGISVRFILHINFEIFYCLMIIVAQNIDHYYMLVFRLIVKLMMKCQTIACLTHHKLSNWKAKLPKLSISSKKSVVRKHQQSEKISSKRQSAVRDNQQSEKISSQRTYVHTRWTYMRTSYKE